MKRHALLVLLAACAGLVACKGPGPKKVGEATLALASGVEEVPAAAEEAPVAAVLPDQPATIPDAPAVKLAIDRQATWGQVKASLDIMDARGQTPVLLVAERRTVRALVRFDQVDAGEAQAEPPADAPAGEPAHPLAALRRHAIELTAYTDGKVCVRHPDIPEAKCVQSPSKQYIDGAFTRQLVREAVEGYGLAKVAVDLPTNLEWDDVVRVVDGARTCCQDRDVRVFVLPAEAFPARVQVPAE